ncbi:TPA: glutaredoxin 2 [Acinetobacter baumannii]|nr:glutaredoxin 2 [Acinetobacter baumannii]
MNLYIYDHCPFCTRARMIFGLKKIVYTEVILNNDDEETPINMIGKKSLPILEVEKGQYLGESLEIIELIDKRFGKPNLVLEPNNDIENWINQSTSLIYELAIPRWAFSNFKEFSKLSSKIYFINKKQSLLGDFSILLKQSKEKITKINDQLEVLNSLINSENETVLSGCWSYTHIKLFPLLRSLSIVKDIQWPDQISLWMNEMSKQSGISLHNDIAL